MEQRHFWISGRVQGVWYRQTTAEKATELGLTGWVRNMADGRVEAVAQGPASVLDTFEAWLHQGPRLARVDSVESRAETPTQEFHAFKARW